MHTIEVADWDELASAIARTEGSGSKKIYRGVTNFSTHKLSPKIGRPGARKDPANGNPLPYSEEDERRFLELLRRDALQFLNRDHTDIELFAIVQHYGASTRLLDWTRAPLIASFFATEKAGTAGQPAVYVLDVPEPFNSATENPFFIADVRSYEPRPDIFQPDISRRISAQKSVLTVHPRPSTPYESPTLEVWLFPERRPSFDLKLKINECGINRASLFQDLGGIAEYAGWAYTSGGFFLRPEASVMEGLSPRFPHAAGRIRR